MHTVNKELIDPLSRAYLKDVRATSRVTVMADDCFEYQIGQCVSHSNQIMPSLITSQIRASNGLEIYTTESYMIDDTISGRVMLGSSLRSVTPGGAVCRECLLWKSMDCPGMKWAA